MKSLILLHGALGAKGQLLDLKAELSDRFDVHVLNFSGHGGQPFAEKGYSMTQFAKEVEVYMHENNIPSANFFGYSMGGYVALTLALQHPELVDNIMTYGTKFNWTIASAEAEVKMLNSEKILEKVPKFAKALQEKHAPLD